MKKLILCALPSIIMILVGGLFLFIGLRRPVTIFINGEPHVTWTRALTVKSVLQDAGVEYSSNDLLEPAENSFLGWHDSIYLNKAVTLSIWDGRTGQVKTTYSHDQVPGNLLLQIGIRLYPGDRIYWNGIQLPLDRPLPQKSTYFLQYKPGEEIEVAMDGESRIFGSSSSSIGSALWEQEIRLSRSDMISRSLLSQIGNLNPIQISRAVPLKIKAADDQIISQSSAPTIGLGLVDGGISLQGLDYTIPAADQPMPSDGLIQMVRVQENISLAQKLIPFNTEFVPDPDTEIDQRSEVEPGQYGIDVIRERVRFEDGTEVSRLVDSQWSASQPVSRKVGYGTQVVIRTLDTPQGPLEYWREVQMYATAYSPCGLGNVSKCYYGTSMGLPVQRGVVAVTYQWYLMMGGEKVYIPGYGSAIIADVGGGIPGRYWIDLGFTDEELEEWHQWVTVYFLTPVPENIPWILP